MALQKTSFGKRLRSETEREELIGAASGVPVLGREAWALASYRPEPSFTELPPLGVMVLHHVVVEAGGVGRILGDASGRARRLGIGQGRALKSVGLTRAAKCAIASGS